MGSGLIWAGIGKGIADAGQSFASAGMKQYELDRQDQRELLRDERLDQREALREERLLARQEALDELKAAREETKLKRDADIYAQAEQNAPAIGDQRRFEKFKKDVGETAMSDDELRGVFNQQYNQQKVGNFEGADRYVEKYSREKEDVLNEIRRLGGSSAAIKEGRESYRATVDAENKAEERARNERRDSQRDRQLDQTANYQAGMVGAAMRQAGAAEARAARSGSRDNTEADITRAEQALSSARSRIEKGFREPTMTEKYDPAKLEAYTAEKNKFVDNHPDVKRQSDRLSRMYEGESSVAKPAPAAAKPGDNPRATVDTLPKGAVQVGTSGGRAVYQTPDGKKFIAK